MSNNLAFLIRWGRILTLPLYRFTLVALGPVNWRCLQSEVTECASESAIPSLDRCKERSFRNSVCTLNREPTMRRQFHMIDFHMIDWHWSIYRTVHNMERRLIALYHNFCGFRQVSSFAQGFFAMLAKGRLCSVREHAWRISNCSLSVTCWNQHQQPYMSRVIYQCSFLIKLYSRHGRQEGWLVVSGFWIFRSHHTSPVAW